MQISWLICKYSNISCCLICQKFTIHLLWLNQRQKHFQLRTSSQPRKYGFNESPCVHFIKESIKSLFIRGPLNVGVNFLQIPSERQALRAAATSVNEIPWNTSEHCVHYWLMNTERLANKNAFKYIANSHLRWCCKSTLADDLKCLWEIRRPWFAIPEKKLLHTNARLAFNVEPLKSRYEDEIKLVSFDIPCVHFSSQNKTKSLESLEAINLSDSAVFSNVHKGRSGHSDLSFFKILKVYFNPFRVVGLPATLIERNLFTGNFYSPRPALKLHILTNLINICHDAERSWIIHFQSTLQFQLKPSWTNWLCSSRLPAFEPSEQH